MRRALVASVALILVAAAIDVSPVGAQVPPLQDPRLEAQALSIERQLLCPICTNERVDVCSTAICMDMKQIIRDRLVAGSTPDDIILYFEQRYGQRVRADLPREGFNLVLFGWVAASLLLVATGGAWFLLSARRVKALATPLEPGVDDAWLDEQIASSEDPPTPEARP